MNFRRRRAAHIRLGRRGEQIAVRLLRSLGMEILCRNYRCAAGELDIVARDGATLVFVEVKTRTPHATYTAEDNLSPRQCRRNLMAARWYLRRLPAEPRCRFELIALCCGRVFLHSIRRYKDYLPEGALR